MIRKAINLMRAIEGLLYGPNTVQLRHVDNAGSHHYDAAVAKAAQPLPTDFLLACSDKVLDRCISRLAAVCEPEPAEITNEELVDLMAAEMVGHIANLYGGEELIRKAFRKALTHEHRTIQQSFISALKLIIEDYDKDRFENHNYDGRNEDSVHWAHEVQSLNKKLGHAGYRFPCV